MDSNLRPKGTTPQPSRFRQSQDLQLSDIWKFLLRWRFVALAGMVLGLLIGFLNYVRAPRLYTSTVTVEMNRDSTSGLGLQDLSGSASSIGVGQEFMTDMLTQQAVLANDSTAISVIDRLNLMETPPYVGLTAPPKRRLFGLLAPKPTNPGMIRDQAVAVFRTKLRVAPVKNTRLMTVSYTDSDQQRSAQVANAIVEEYLLNHTRTRFEATSKASTWLNEQLGDLKHQAEAVHKQVVELERDSGLFTMSIPSSVRGSGEASDGGNSNPELARLSALNSALSQAELVRIQQGTVYRITQASDPDALLDLNGPHMAMSEGTALAPGSAGMLLIQSLRSQESAIKLKMAGEKGTYAVKNPEMVDLQNQLDSVHAQLSEEIARVRGQVKKDYDLALTNEQAIRREMEEQQQRVATLGNHMNDLAFLQEEENTSRKLYQDLYTRLEEADIAAGVRSSGMAVVDPARPASTLSSPKLNSDLGAGFSGGLVAALLLAIFLQMRDTTLNIPDQFEENCPVPLLGVVPGFEEGLRSRYGYGTRGASESKEQSTDQAWILRRPKSKVAESYRQIRTSIALARVDDPPKVLLFTSPVGGDGKSTTAYNMAAAFAAQSYRVLILDADMRRSTLGKLTGNTGKRGLSDVLSQGLDVNEVIQQNPNLPTLYAMLAGITPPDPAELLGSKRFTALIAQLRTQFDYVLIDAPPALLVTDPIVAATSTDAIICVVRAGKTLRPELRRFWSVLDHPSIRVLGFIVNDFNSRLQSYAYGYEGYRSSSYQYYADKEQA